MRKNISGFTIVEIITVIVVIGIIASIAIVSYRGSQDRAQNASRISELKVWEKSFLQYKATNGTYPAMANGGYCLGTGFTNQKCRDYTGSGASTYTEAASTTLMTTLQSYDPPSVTTHVPSGATVGPYVVYNATQVRMYGVFNGTASECPSGTEYDWDDGAGRLLCRIILIR